MLQVTPNGSYGKGAHAQMPVSVDELLADLRACFVAGARGVHLHVRDGSGAETLDPVAVNDTARRVRDLADEVGVEVEIGLTTGAWIVPGLQERVGMIREWEGVDCATVNLSEDGYQDVMAAMLDVGVGIDVGLWAPTEMDGLVRSGLLPSAQRVSIELDPDEGSEPIALAQRLNTALDEAGSVCPRLTHGSGDWTWLLVADAFRRGHDTRVGFEDSVLLPSGQTARNNAELVAAAATLRGRLGPGGPWGAAHR